MDPNKYKKNADIKPETLLQTLISVGSMLLMILGIIGLALDLFKADGLLGKIFSYLFQSTGTMLLIPLIIGALWLLNRWISSTNKGETKKGGNLPMYAMVLIGAYYLLNLTTTGGL